MTFAKRAALLRRRDIAERVRRLLAAGSGFAEAVAEALRDRRIEKLRKETG